MLGIDPGYAIVGYGVLDYSGNKFRVVDYGAITTSADLSFSRRLEIIWEEYQEIIKKYNPQCMAIEKVFFSSNAKTAINVAQARGVLLLGAQTNCMGITQYTPPEIKQAVVGYGNADKNQVQQMTKMILGLPAVPKPDDTADALAVAICHAHSAGSYMNKINF